ncbi:MAG: UDP-N-acetylmuramate--L-alanine ligase, partial [Acidobacteria bacterium]|nr:UDP-N-acetylmuramate--L-alanine ligase [Acidobacteriota bacterium]
MLKAGSRVHFVGVGGIGMSALAALLLKLDQEVSGSDLKASPQTEKLQDLGAVISVGSHQAANLKDPDLVVVSSAVPSANPEVVEARRRGIDVVHRSDLLAALMAGKRSIAVAGSHGKTTTTAMIGLLLVDAGLDPTCVVGGLVPQLGGNARLGRSDYLVVETDESDRSFLKLRPQMAVITNIDREHMAAYRDEENLLAAFQAFANGSADPSRCVVCVDDPRVRQILGGIEGRPVTYGLKTAACFTAEGVEQRFRSCTFRVRRETKVWGDVRLNIGGTHNVLNALSVVAISTLLDIAPETAVQSLGRFQGVARRMERKGASGGVEFYDDYAHHPTEIRATLAAAKQSGRRLVVVFQPHRYTRTRELFEAFASCFGDADALFILEIYPAGEPALQGITSARLAEEISRAGPVAARFVEDGAAVEEISSHLREGDMVLTLGAGDVD